jgi:hypothetical protein
VTDIRTEKNLAAFRSVGAQLADSNVRLAAQLERTTMLELGTLLRIYTEPYVVQLPTGRVFGIYYRIAKHSRESLASALRRSDDRIRLHRGARPIPLSD